jgi:hypothetical protein
MKYEDGGPHDRQAAVPGKVRLHGDRRDYIGGQLMPAKPTNDAERALLHVLVRTRDQWKEVPGLAYRGPADFLLQHGIFYPVPAHARMPQGAPLTCYGNALAWAAVRGWPYVEGVAIDRLKVPMAHAWNVENGELRDTTWMNTGLAYFGVEFCTERADDCAWNGDASVLNDGNRGWPLLRQHWAGEPAGANWARSDRLDAMRSGDTTRMFEILAEMTKEVRELRRK